MIYKTKKMNMNKLINQGKIACITLCSLLLILASCGSDSKDDPTPPTPEKKNELQGKLTKELTLEAGETYELIGGYEVEEGGVLNIEEGVTIIATQSIDGAPDYILIKQGGKINAIGTAENPIVMTANNKKPGAWGGVHICGKAPVNLQGGQGKSEIGDATFGGNNPTDNSGTMKYVRLEYTGFAFSPTKESNGLTLYGVGNGTSLSYLQTYYGADDGFEWFGGTVNAKYLVSTASEDDSFDWTDGWVGKGQFWVAYQDQSAPDSNGTANGDCLIEADNREDNFTNTPVSCPTLANITLVGNNDKNKQQRGIRLRAGTQIKLYNTLVTGKDKSITIATDETHQSFIDKNSLIEYSHLSTSFFYETGEDLNLSTAEGNTINQNITNSLTNGYIGVIPGGKDLSKEDDFFTSAPYIGAVPQNEDWTKGWTKR